MDCSEKINCSILIYIITPYICHVITGKITPGDKESIWQSMLLSKNLSSKDFCFQYYLIRQKIHI